jgi:hypothetical protein
MPFKRRRSSFFLLQTNERASKAKPNRASHHLMTFLIVASVVIGITLAFTDKRNLAEIIEDLIKRK